LVIMLLDYLPEHSVLRRGCVLLSAGKTIGLAGNPLQRLRGRG
jgi:hypothetical protein